MEPRVSMDVTVGGKESVKLKGVEAFKSEDGEKNDSVEVGAMIRQTLNG
jgi:hypothetical protein